MNWMRGTGLAVVMLASVIGTAGVAGAAELKLGANDTVQSVLTAQKGVRVTVRVRSGQELTGVVKDVTPRLVQLGAVAGKEFFDAVVPLESVDAVFVRTRDQ